MAKPHPFVGRLLCSNCGTTAVFADRPIRCRCGKATAKVLVDDEGLISSHTAVDGELILLSVWASRRRTTY